MAQLISGQKLVAYTYRAVVLLPDGERDPAHPVTYWDDAEEAKAHLRSCTESRGANADGYVTPCYYSTERNESERIWLW